MFQVSHIIDSLIRRHVADKYTHKHCLEKEIEISGNDVIIPINGTVKEGYFFRQTPDRSYGDGVRKKFQVYRTLGEHDWSTGIPDNNKNSNLTFKSWCTQKSDFEDKHKEKLKIFLEGCFVFGSDLEKLFDKNGYATNHGKEKGIQVLFDNNGVGTLARNELVGLLDTSGETNHRINFGGNNSLFSETENNGFKEKKFQNVSNWKAFEIQFM